MKYFCQFYLTTFQKQELNVSILSRTNGFCDEYLIPFFYIKLLVPVCFIDTTQSYINM